MMRLSDQILGCPNCDYKARSSNMRKHIGAVHGEETLKKFKEALVAKKAAISGSKVQKCEVCAHICPTIGGMKTHMKLHKRNEAVKPVDPSEVSLFEESGEKDETNVMREPPKKKFHCDDTVYDTVNVYGRVTRPASDVNTVKERERDREMRMRCPVAGCLVTVGTRLSLVEHMAANHDSRFNLENDEFYDEKALTVSRKQKDNIKNMKLIKEWMDMRQTESTTTFIKKKTVQSESGSTTYYHCQHEGKYDSKGTLRFGHVTKKETGTSSCPAFLKVFSNAEKQVFKVVGCFQHHGHKQEVVNQKLNEEDFEVLKKMMLDGFTNKQILHKLVKTYNENHRLFFSTPDDLSNLRKRELLFPGRRHDNDLESILLRVNESNDSDGIRLYNPPENASGEGFRLVIITPQQIDLIKKYSHRGITMDDTHHCTTYRLKLSTMLVCDGYDRGVPVAFLLSFSTTTIDVEKMFECVKVLFPQFNPQFVMSDEAYVFYNGFSNVFPGSHARKVLCRWHIFRTWKKMAKNTLNESSLLKLLPKLRELLREPVKEHFNRRITEILHFLGSLEGKKGEIFADYFRSRYLDRVSEWSTTEREGIIFHTSMYAESWHSMLKKEILDGKTKIRVDTLVNQLYNAVEWVARKLAKGIPRLAKNHRHCRTAALELRHYVVIEEQAEFDGERAFRVGRVGTDVEKMYIVTEKPSCLCLKEENTHCSCGGCGYRHLCTCLNQEAGVCCKHIHMALRTIESEVEVFEIDGSDVMTRTSSPDLSVPHRPINPPPKSIQPAATTEKDNVLQKLEQLIGAHSTLEEYLRKKLATDPDGAASEIQNALDAVLPLLPSNQPALPLRRHASHSLTARQTMNEHLKLEVYYFLDYY
ncbi:hypothetical protein GCK72_021073 [Caenorhabditis remanei]|uniref:C2H2-type domain-containing protein n=1 Tax=Caenorhabditis remanei TaxID=31234 RepID=A0A6A5GH51_CAERE|nr:hypothetical protein GCK72_021073 [Caenorhabditis remanei]KAF1754510.1 hypothetical protein GCK72_021073 [Caenorhabditis remanei]